jgi:acyl-coenzyme A thioesterase PaaI-like protein
MFIGRLGVSYHVEADLVIGRFEATDEMRVPGTTQVRAGVLATMADIVAGWGANGSVFPRIPLTVDLTVHPLGPLDSDVVRVVARMLKVGRTTIVAETLFMAADSEQPAVLSHATFMVSPRPEDVFHEPLAQRVHLPPSMGRPILDDIGVRIVGRGVAELDRVTYVMQPSGTIQGGAIALLAEAAAESLSAVPSSVAGGNPVTGLEVRYLSAVRRGPARASASALAPGLVRVDVRDVGNAARLAAVVLART